MNTVFSVDDFSDPSWSASVSGAAAGMNRSQSEWALERFLEELSGAGAAIPGSRAGVNPKAEKGDGNNPPPSYSIPTVPIDLDGYRAILKNKLEQACAAVALSRASTVKAEGSSTQVENQVLQSVSDVQCSSKTQEQGEPDVGISAVSSTQKKTGTQVRQTTSGSSREDSGDGELEGDTETTKNMDPDDAKRARRMRSNRESARRSRRRKQAHMNELEAQVGQLRVEHSTLLKHLTDMNHKYDEAAVDNRILKADIEMLRAKYILAANSLGRAINMVIGANCELPCWTSDANVGIWNVANCETQPCIFMPESAARVKMAEETVKQMTGINPVVVPRSNLPSTGMPFVSSPLETSTTSVALQPDTNQLLHQSAPSITTPMHPLRPDNSFAGNNVVTPVVNPQTEIGVETINRTSALQHMLGGVQKHIGPGLLSHSAAKNKKQS